MNPATLFLPPIPGAEESGAQAPTELARLSRRRLRVLFFLFLCAMRFLIQRLFGRLLGNGIRRRRAEAIRREMQSLGGLWVKLGQIISLRPDLFGEEIGRALSDLLDRVGALPYDRVEQVFVEELGVTPAAEFAWIAPEPLAAGSIGQVYRARDYTGRDLAVKIQRPDAAGLFASDLAFVRRTCQAMVLLRILPSARWTELVWELGELVRTELDYRFEASHLRAMRTTLQKQGIVIPRVNSRLSSLRVITMEFIPGVPLSDYIRAADKNPEALREWERENSIDPKAIAWHLYETHTRQVYEDNYFHGDLHPGNVMICRGNVLGLIDFGAAGSLDTSRLRKYFMLFDAVYERDFSKVADIFLVLAPSVPQSRYESVKEEIIRVMRMWQTNSAVPDLPYHDRSLTYAMTQVASILRRHRIPITWDSMQVNRAELTMDLSLAYLMPDANFYELIGEYRRKIQLEQLARAFDHNRWLDRAESWSKAFNLPAVLAENAEFNLERVRTQAMNVTDDLSTLSLLGRALLTLTAAASVVLASLLTLDLSQSVVAWPVGQWAHDLLGDAWPATRSWSAWLRWLAATGAWYAARVLIRARRRVSEG